MSGGKQTPRDVNNYAPPTGIKQNPPGPGIGGDNYGNSGTQGKSSITAQTSGAPGIGGTVKLPQGKK